MARTRRVNYTDPSRPNYVDPLKRQWRFNAEKFEALLQKRIKEERDAELPRTEARYHGRMSEIAKVAGVTTETLAQWRKGTTSDVPFEAPWRLAAYFDVGIDAICDDVTPR